MKKIKLLFITTVLAMGLSACSENGFLFRSGSSLDDSDSKSVYYVGAPYRIKGVLYVPKEDMNYSEKGVATWYSRDSQNRLTTNGEVFDDDKMTAAHKTLPLPSLVRITNLENGNTAIVRVNDRGPAVNNRLIDVSRKTAEALEMPETGTTLVQVDILPDESRRLKEGLEEFVEQTEQETEKEIPVGSVVPIYKPENPAEGTPLYNGQAKEETLADLPEPVVPVSENVKVETENEISANAMAPGGSWQIQAGVFGMKANADRTMQRLGQIAPVSTQTDGRLITVFVGPFSTEEEARSTLATIHQAGYTDAWVKKIK